MYLIILGAALSSPYCFCQFFFLHLFCTFASCSSLTVISVLFVIYREFKKNLKYKPHLNTKLIMWQPTDWLNFEPNVQGAAALLSMQQSETYTNSVTVPWDCRDARWVFPGSWRRRWPCDPAAVPGRPDTAQSAQWLPARRSSWLDSETQSSGSGWSWSVNDVLNVSTSQTNCTEVNSLFCNVQV